jgi:hypothetical protein
MPLWCLVMPITSLLIVPSIQGTIPAYLMAFASLALVLPSREDGWFESQRARYLSIALLLAGLWLLLFSASQLAHIISDRHTFGDLSLIRNDDRRVLLRPAIFTQTLYLVACICTALFFRFFFREEWMRYVFWGAWFLALYGIYEWLFFLVFKEPGDFIANRMYGDHPGSWSQTMQVGPLTLLRIKSTFGEPSWFSAAVIPYFILALEYRRRLLAVALLFCIVFSTSTSAFVGFAFAIIFYGVLKRKLNVSLVTAALLFATAFAVLYFLFPETFDQMFGAKFRGENLSGQGRQEHSAATADTENTLTLLNRIFGIGFGYHYGGAFFAILMNTGWIGIAVYCYAFLKPVLLLPADSRGIPLKVSLATLLVLFYISVSELFLPTTWMFLGLAYWQLDKSRAYVAWIPRQPPARPEAVPRLAPAAKGQLARRNCLSNLSPTRLRGARMRRNF